MKGIPCVEHAGTFLMISLPIQRYLFIRCMLYMCAWEQVLMSMHLRYVCTEKDRNSICGSWSLSMSKSIWVIKSVPSRTVQYMLFKYYIHIHFMLLNNICFS